MTEKSENTVQVTPEVQAEAIAWMTPERLAAFDAMTNKDIAAQIASNPAAASELTDEWLECSPAEPAQGPEEGGGSADPEYWLADSADLYMFAHKRVAARSDLQFT